MKYNKLVRDRIPEIIAKKGDKAITHIADEHEFWKALKEKLFEELREFEAAEGEADMIEELADIFEVIDAICDFKKFDQEVVRGIQKKKAEEKGGFRKRIILDES